MIENIPVPFISSTRNVIRMTLMLMGIWGLVAFAVPVQAAGCHQNLEGQGHHAQSQMSGNEPVVSSVQPNTSRAMQQDMQQEQETMAAHDCCAPDCHCPSALCGAGHGVPLTTIFTLPSLGATEQIQCATDLYSLLPPSLLIKPPMAA